MGIYNDDGFVNFEWVVDKKLPFNFLIGGRGIGKTFGCLEYLLFKGEKFMFTRRTEKQLENISTPDSDPTIDINKKHGTNFIMKKVRGSGICIYDGKRNAEGIIEPIGTPIGVCQSLSTVGNLRGAGGGTDFKYLVYDEFIKLNHEKSFKGEDSAFNDLYETLNRNRELPPPMGEGSEPLQAFLLSNSNRIDTPVIASFGLINQLSKMQIRSDTTGEDQIYINRDRGILVVYFADSSVSKAKKNTALYKALSNDTYTDMALNNRFANEVSAPDIVSRPIKEYIPIISVGEITVYKHKSRKEYYVNSRKADSPVKFGTCSEDLGKFSKRFGWLYNSYICDEVLFENFGAKISFIHYFTY